MEIGSESWCTAMSDVLADVELPEVQATVEQRIGGGNGGPVVAYRLVIDSGRAHLEPVPADAETARGESGEHGEVGETVVMSQSRETAEAVRRGELGALAALQAGLITVNGDVRVLIAASEALALVNTALGQALADGEDSASTGDAAATDDGADGDRPDGPGDAGGTSEPDGPGGG
ncbi:hypothetical protein [Candidatus Poriferisodalis sp.]|uniref:hypothetical protein n=1 Tax=Candidatus Poriferisodalis sp. TaxID=3101277 RepID=UPI003B595F2F